MTIEWNICPGTPGKVTTRPDRAIAERAARQHGVVSRAQLLGLGLGYRAIDERIAGGRLHPVHRGVYAVGHPLRTRHATWMAAVLAGGTDTVLASRSGGALWRVRDSGVLEVISPRKLRRPGIRAHGIVLADDEVTLHEGIPVTTPARTLFDLATVLTLDQLEFAFNEAEYRRLSSPTSLDALLARYPKRPGTANLRRVLEKHRARTPPRRRVRRLRRPRH